MPDKEVPVKDFLEEHRRLKEEKIAVQAPPPAQPALQPTTAPRSSHPMPQQAVQPAVSQPVSSAEPQPQSISFIQLVEALRSLGYDVQPLESLKGFADKLDAEEKRLMKEINERQERLRVVREARRLLRVLGV